MTSETKPGEGVEPQFMAQQLRALAGDQGSPFAGRLQDAADLIEAMRERAERAEQALVARHGGEPLALLEELDEARAKLAEVERERDEARYHREEAEALKEVYHTANETLARQRYAAEAQVAELRKDAERYRKLRQEDPMMWKSCARVIELGQPDDMDELLDAAIAMDGPTPSTRPPAHVEEAPESPPVA